MKPLAEDIDIAEDAAEALEDSREEMSRLVHGVHEYGDIAGRLVDIGIACGEMRERMRTLAYLRRIGEDCIAWDIENLDHLPDEEP
jgi:hypothetical protein